MKASILIMLSVIGVTVAGGAEEDPEQVAAIVDVLDTQTQAWNGGKLEGFMAGYWESPDLIFTSGGWVNRGWETTLEKYRETYGGGMASMGQLSFEEVEVHSLGAEAAWVLGRWQLQREGESSGGIFTLVFRKISGRWLIVHDHTSVEE
ncbi:MAG: nuclear transport factor 2 family protein [Thermoanaerobaculia bacterium]